MGSKESNEYLMSLLARGTTTMDPGDVPTKVSPSGLLLATVPAPMAPPAPGLNDNTTGCPKNSPMRSAKGLIMLSVSPGAKGITSCMGLLGNGSAACPGKAMAKKGAAVSQIPMRIDFLRASNAMKAGVMGPFE